MGLQNKLSSEFSGTSSCWQWFYAGILLHFWTWKLIWPNVFGIVGNGVEITILGQRQLKLTEHHETYETSSPKLFIRFFPMPANEWLGNTTVRCIESGLEASVSFKGRGFFGFRGSSNRVSGKIWEISTKRVLYELNGSWDKWVPNLFLCFIQVFIFSLKIHEVAFRGLLNSECCWCPYWHCSIMLAGLWLWRISTRGKFSTCMMPKLP